MSSRVSVITPCALSSGASIPFVDPALPAPEAPVCWLTSAVAPALEAVAHRPTAETPVHISIFDLRSVRNVIVGPAREEILILRDSHNALTLRLHGSGASRAPVGVTFLVRGIPEPQTLSADFRVLRALVHSPQHRVHRSRERLFLRDALVALDGRRAGAGHREAAEVIFGAKRVAEEWSGRGGWLKERMRRALAKGEELRDGGYRKSLEGACRFSL